MKNPSDMQEAKISSFFRHYTVVFCVLAVLIPLAYSLYTGHIWEDFFITFRHSKNLCEGNGLVYQPAERVHGFTSPLGTLLPAFCYFLTGCKSYLYAIWLFRILFCIPAFVGGGIFLLKTLEKNKISSLFLGILYLLEAKSVVFSVSGMETSFMLFFLAWSFYLLQRDISRNWFLLGISWLGLMWTRPDSFIYIGALIISTIIFSKNSHRITLAAVLKAAAISAVFYSPWFIWAWIYYGSPIPHTVLAKAGMSHHEDILLLFINAALRLPQRISWVFGPIYPHFITWPSMITIFGYFIGMFCFIYWLLPVKDKIGKTASLIFFFLCLYFAVMPFPYPWYFPPAAMMGLLIVTNGFFTIAETGENFLPRKKNAVLPLSFVAIFMFLIFSLTVYQMKLQQSLIETGTRRKVGEWLKKNISESDRIYLECLGYIGYFSEGKILDYPGLATPEVVKLCKKNNLSFITLVPELKPEWIVLRGGEYLQMSRLDYFRNNYHLIKVFDATDGINNYPYIPGEAYLLYDSLFFIFSKNKQKS